MNTHTHTHPQTYVSACAFTHVLAHVHVSHAHTCAHAHLQIDLCMCVCSNPGIFWYLAPPRSPLLYAACSPQLGGMVEMLVTLFGVTGSGDCRLPPKHGYRFGSSGAGKPKGGTKQLAWLCHADYQFYLICIYFNDYIDEVFVRKCFL